MLNFNLQVSCIRSFGKHFNNSAVKAYLKVGLELLLSSQKEVESTMLLRGWL